MTRYQLETRSEPVPCAAVDPATIKCAPGDKLEAVLIRDLEPGDELLMQDAGLRPYYLEFAGLKEYSGVDPMRLRFTDWLAGFVSLDDPVVRKVKQNAVH